ncbi:MAG TPA: STAS domain-containing protein [Acidimicrobiia bacterium]|nr:STAS domain-containing protein [Acidimicrobiia bacterium]
MRRGLNQGDLASGRLLASLNKEGDVFVVVLFGALDYSTASMVEKVLFGMRPSDPVILDLAGLRFVDWAGFRSLFSLKEGPRPGSLFIRNPPPSIRRFLEIVELGRLLEDEPKVER